MEERRAITIENHGEKIFAIFHAPKVKHKVPVVLICHGLAGTKSGKFRIYVKLAECLAKNGIATLRFDFRGSGDSEGDFETMSIQSEVDDTLKVLEILVAQPEVDPTCVGFLGSSLGGAVSVLVAKEYKKLSALALWSPIYSGEQWRVKGQNIEEELKQLPREARRISGVVAGEEMIKQLLGLDASEPLEKLRHIPLLHIQSQADEVVLYQHAIKYKMAREGLDNTFVSLSKSDHVFSDPLERQQVIETTCSWFKKQLKRES